MPVMPYLVSYGLIIADVDSWIAVSVVPRVPYWESGCTCDLLADTFCC